MTVTLMSVQYHPPIPNNRNGISDKARAESVEEGKEKKSKYPPAHYHGEAARNVTANVRMADDSIDSYHYHN